MAALNPQDEISSKGFEEDARIYDYVKACNPVLPAIPVLAHDPAFHRTGKLRWGLDLSPSQGLATTIGFQKP